MENTKMNKVTNVALWCAALITTIYLLLLGYYNVLALDDYGCIADVEEKGIFGYVRNMYLTWQGRWSAFFVDAVYYKIWGHASNLITFTIVQLLIGYTTVYALLRKLFVKVPIRTCILYVVLLVNLSILALQEISTFYWLCCPHYLLCVWAFIWLCYILFLIKEYKWWHALIIIILSVYLSGIAESFTPLVIMVLGIKWLYNIIKYKRYNFFQHPQDRYLTISLLILAVGFLIMVLAPGNSTRVDTMSESSFMNHFVLSAFCVQWVKATVILLLRFLSKSLYYGSILLISLYVGYTYKDELVKAIPVLDAKKIVGVVIGLLVFFAISVAPCVYAMGWYAPPRSFSYMSFVFAFCAAWIGLSIGANFPSRLWLMIITAATAIGITMMASIWIVREQPVISDYQKWVKVCLADIQKKVDNCDKTPYLAPTYTFPAELNTYSRMCKLAGKNRKEYQYPYMLFDLTTDPHYWKNEDLQKYMHADFEIIGQTQIQ